MRASLEIPMHPLDSTSTIKFQPAVSALRLKGRSRWLHSPIFVRENQRQQGEFSLQARTLRNLFEERLKSLSIEEPQTGVVADNLGHLLECLCSNLSKNLDQADIQKVANDAGKKFLDTLESNDEAKDQLNKVVNDLLSGIMEPGWIVGRRRVDLGALCSIAIRSHRCSVFEYFRRETKRLVGCLESRLQVEFLHSPEGSEPDTLAGSFGKMDSIGINAETLAQNLPPYRGARRLSNTQLARLEKTVATLRHWMHSDDNPEDLILLASKKGLADIFPGSTAPSVKSNIFSNAMDCFDRTAGEWVEFFRAFRTALLEVENAYEPDLHDEAIANMDWSTLTEKEFALIPPVVALEESTSIEGKSLDFLNQLLDSARPVVIILTDVADGFDPSALQTIFGASHAGLAAPIIARGNVFVIQSSLARPKHLFTGLTRLMGSSRPGVALVSVPAPGDSEELAEQFLEGALGSRTTPCFVFDPDGGNSWAACFDLNGNPQKEHLWPEYEIELSENSESKEGNTSLRLTLPDYAALKLPETQEITVIPSSEWSEQQYPLAEYLDRLQTEENAGYPFILVVNEEGTFRRALVSDKLVNSCLERVRCWRLLQELGGINNEYALLASDRAKLETAAQKDNERETLLNAQKDELEKVRLESARETIDRLVAILVSDTPLSIADLAAEGEKSILVENLHPIEAASAALLEEGGLSFSKDKVVGGKKQEDKEEMVQVRVADPYIDSALCTTCNECTNLNPLLFKYNDNKQAYIADLEAGTFTQLVQAAEKCPARCIHPGEPRPGDKTSTKSVLAKAAQFN